MKIEKRERPVLFILVMIFAFVPGCHSQIALKEQNTRTSNNGIVSPIQSMTAKRAAHSATLLNNGKVLIAGGFVANGGGLSSAEVFDSRTKTFTPAPNMTVARASHTATLLPDGRVLISGGYNGEYLKSSEVYDPATNRFTSAGQMVTARSGHVAALLNDGKVLLVGGTGTGWTFLADAEIYDPRTSTFSPTGGMATGRESHTATLLNDGKVLIIGGHKGRRADITIYKSAEIYDPTTGTFEAAGNLTVRRHKHDATRLADGRVLIIAGADERDGNGAYTNAEIFDPTDKTFTAIKNDMNTARYKLQGTAILLRNGKVLIAGGSDRAEVFDPATNSFSFAEGDMGTKRLFATATLLKDGEVLIAGGYTDGPTGSSGAWIYRI